MILIKPDAEDLVLTHLALVKAIAKRSAKRLPRSIEMDDIMQVGTMALMKAAESPLYDPERGPFGPFAAIVIRRAIVTAYRRKNYHYELHGDLHENLRDPEPGPDEIAERRRVCKHVRNAMESLSKPEREVLLDRADDKSYAEAGARHNRSASWAFYQARCAEGKMRRSLAIHKLHERSR